MIEAGNVTFLMEELPNGILVTFLKINSTDVGNHETSFTGGGTIGGISGGIKAVLKYIEAYPGCNGVAIAAALEMSQRTL